MSFVVQRPFWGTICVFTSCLCAIFFALVDGLYRRCRVTNIFSYQENPDMSRPTPSVGTGLMGWVCRGRGLSSKEFLGVTERSSGLRPHLCKVIKSNLIIDKLREGTAVSVIYFQRLFPVYKGCHGSSEAWSYLCFHPPLLDYINLLNRG